MESVLLEMMRVLCVEYSKSDQSITIKPNPMLEAIIAALHAAESSGWKLVPKEMTQDMMDARMQSALARILSVVNEVQNYPTSNEASIEDYGAILSAAPKLPEMKDG
jgi:hypothetical protein